MTTGYFVLMLAGMALTTYLIRMLPFVAFQRKIRSRFARSFLYYTPYAVLASMTVPAILYSTDSLLSAAVGFAAALIMSFFRRSLLPVAVVSCWAAFLTSWIVSML